MGIDTVTVDAKSVHHLLEHMREDAHSTHQLKCQGCSCPCHSKHATSCVSSSMLFVQRI